MSVRLEIGGRVAKPGVWGGGVLGEKLLVGLEPRPVGAGVVVEVDVSATKPSVGHQL